MRTRAAEKSWRDGRVFADDRETKRCYPQTAQAVGGQQVVGGRGGIRTHVRIAPKPDFESGAFNHSATLPHKCSEGSMCRVSNEYIVRAFVSGASSFAMPAGRNQAQISSQLVPFVSA